MGYYYDKFDKCDKHDKNNRFDKCDKHDKDDKCDKLMGLNPGDIITVFQAGSDQGTGTFLRIECNFLVWREDDGSLNFTSLTGIHIERTET